MIEIPEFKTKREGIDWVIKNNDLIVLERKNSIKHADYSTTKIEGFDAQKGMIQDYNIKLECLIYEAEVKKDRNEFMFNQYKAGRVLNHSVGMRYIKYVLCVNSDDPSESIHKEMWDKHYPFVINKEVANSRDWFYAVIECKNIEGSAVVKGSNFLTPTLSVSVIDDNTLLVKAIINVCGIIDTHMDCHIPKCWNKTITDNNFDLFLQEHEMEFDKVIADSVSDKLTVKVENISIKELNSRFKANKNIEPTSVTQKAEADKVTSRKKAIHLLTN
jgi:hypothetical protein